MSSERRKQASRANGAKSHGPVTPEGKERSAQSNYRHGILSRGLVLREENGQAFLDILTALEATFQPQDEFELNCVETMAVARWRCMRIWGMETAGLQQEMDKSASTNLDNPTRAAVAFRDLADTSKFLELMGRYEVRYDRQYARSFNLLMKHRASAPKAPISPTVPETKEFPTNLIPKSDTSPIPSPPAPVAQTILSAAPRLVSAAPALPSNLIPKTNTCAAPHQPAEAALGGLWSPSYAT